MCVEYCEWLRPQGGTAGSGSLAHNEGDVPHLLPVSDASLNQDLREVKKRWRRGGKKKKKKSQLLSRLPCGRLAVLAVRRFLISVHHNRARGSCLLPQRLGPASLRAGTRLIDFHVCLPSAHFRRGRAPPAA